MVFAKRVAGVLVIAVALTFAPARAATETAPLRFAWPMHGEAVVELTDERSVGDERRTIVMTMRLHVQPDGDTGRLVVRLGGAKLVSIDGATPGETDPAHALLTMGRVMKAFAPAMIIGADGRYLGLANAGTVMGDVLSAAGFPAPPPGLDAFASVFDDIAREDWNVWVGAWLGASPAAGDTWGRARLDASTIHSSESVKGYTAGFLIDMARESEELGEDPVASRKFLAKARYSPMTEAFSVELDPKTMRPFLAERTRSFYAVNGKHRVEGRERRTHRFTWAAQDMGAGAKTP
jgi:hypothetical protein